KVDNKFSTGILDKLDASGELSEYFREKLQMAPRAENRRPVLAEDLDFTVDGKNTEAAQKEFLKEFIRERSLKPPYSIANDFGERISKGVHQVDALAQVLGKNDLMLEAGRDAQRCGYLPHIIAEALSVIPATVLKSLRQAGLKTIKIAEASAGDALLHYERGVLFIQGQAIKVLSQDEFAAELYTNIGRIFLASLPQSKIEGLSRDFKMIKMRGSALKRESESLGYSFIEVEEEEELTDYLLRLLTYYILTGERLREVVNGDAAFSATYATIRPSIRRIYDLFKFSFEWKEYTSFDFIGFRTALAKARKKSSKVSGKKTKGGITIIRSIASQLADYADVLGTTHDQEDRQWLMIEDSIFAKLKALAAIDTRGLKRLEKAKLPYRVKSFKCVKDVISCFPPSETYELWEQALLEDKKGTFIANMEKHFLHELLIEIDRILNRHAMRPFLNSEQQSLLSEQRERLFFLACRCSRGSATLKNDIIFATGNLKKFGLPEIGFGYEKEGELIKGTASLPAERSVNAPPYASDALRATLSRNLRCPSTPSIFDNTIEEPGAAVGAKREGWQAQTQSSRALFRPDPDSVRFYYKKASGQFRRAYFIKKALHFIYNFLLVHFFDIDDNNSFRAFDVETDDVARVFIKSKQNPRMFYTEGESVKIWVSAIENCFVTALESWSDALGIVPEEICRFKEALPAKEPEGVFGELRVIYAVGQLMQALGRVFDDERAEAIINSIAIERQETGAGRVIFHALLKDQQPRGPSMKFAGIAGELNAEVGAKGAGIPNVGRAEVVVSKNGMKDVFVIPDDLVIDMLSDARKYREDIYKRSGATFYKRYSGCQLVWVFREKDKRAVAKVLKLDLREDVQVKPDEYVFSITGLKELFFITGMPWRKVPSAKTYKKDRMTYKGIIFRKIRRASKWAWAYKKKDKNKVARAFKLHSNKVAFLAEDEIALVSQGGLIEHFIFGHEHEMIMKIRDSLPDINDDPVQVKVRVRGICFEKRFYRRSGRATYIVWVFGVRDKLKVAKKFGLTLRTITLGEKTSDEIAIVREGGLKDYFVGAEAELIQKIRSELPDINQDPEQTECVIDGVMFFKRLIPQEKQKGIAAWVFSKKDIKIVAEYFGFTFLCEYKQEKIQRKRQRQKKERQKNRQFGKIERMKKDEIAVNRCLSKYFSGGQNKLEQIALGKLPPLEHPRAKAVRGGVEFRKRVSSNRTVWAFSKKDIEKVA
ncbi:MAG: hypothetical protein JRI96_16515, partial [Deltaproteobacteria bacterium]|nr:hypothetical protein [Deltaproteobacteria bacterium]